MIDQRIGIEISPKTLTFQPGGDGVAVTVCVINRSDRFASFQLELMAAGASEEAYPAWYRLLPEVSSKVPPGDSTPFQIELLDSPVVGFTGQMTLTARAFSVELQAEVRDRLTLTLTEGHYAVRLLVKLPVAQVQVVPGEPAEIVVQVENPSQRQVSARLRFQGLPDAWMVGGSQRSLRLAPRGQSDVVFTCHPPEDATQVPRQVYPYQVTVMPANGPPTVAAGRVQVNPMGTLTFSCEPIRAVMRRSWRFWRAEAVTYALQFQNESNVYQQITAEVETEQSDCTLALRPERQEVGLGEIGQLLLVVEAQRSWLWRLKRIDIPVWAQWSEPDRLNTPDDHQFLHLRVPPILPRWLTIVLVPVVGILIWALSPWNQHNPRYGHQAEVTAVQFNGIADEAVSSSVDQTASLWRISGLKHPWEFPFLKKLVQRDDQSRVGKALLTIKYRPFNNDQVAVGLENGEVQLWDLKATSRSGPRQSFYAQIDDRVFDVVFTLDAQYLFSVHGSGRVLQWPLRAPGRLQRRSAPILEVPFAIYNAALVGEQRDWLAIAGQSNQLMLWNWQTQEARQSLNYPVKGGQQQYIQGLAIATESPTRLAVADDQGHISLWDLQSCLNRPDTCPELPALEQWRTAHGGQPVRSVALSDDGCYLVSGGDDGRVMLWPLGSDGRRTVNPDFHDGIQLFPTTDWGPDWISQRFWRWISQLRYGTESLRITSVDIKVVDHEIRVLSGDTLTQVSLHLHDRRPFRSEFDCDRPPAS